MLLQKVSESPGGLARFQREAQITSLLRHPHIVQVLDYNTAPDGTAYMAMEYLTGESLAQRLCPVGSGSLRKTREKPTAIVSACFDLGADGGSVCAELCPDTNFNMACGSGGTCQRAGTDYGICRP